MSAHRYPASYNGILFNRVYDGSGLVDDPAHLVDAYRQSDYRLEEMDPTRVTVEDFRELRQWLEGAEANESFEGVMFLTGRGRIHASSPGDLEDKTGAMRAAFSPAQVRIASLATDPLGVLPFDFTVDTVGGSSARRAYCRPAIGRPVVVGRTREGLTRRFVFQLISIDPKIYSQTLHQTVVSLGGQQLANAGNYYVYPKVLITFAGAGDANLTITNTTTGEAIVIDASTAASAEVWVLDTRRSKVYRQSDLASRYSARVSGWLSDLYLPAGNSDWTFANVTNVTSIEFDYRDAWA